MLAHRRPGRGAVPSGRERGSVLIVVAICLAVLVTATALTVDLGRISVTRRDLQNVADVAAMDLSRQLDGRTTAQIVADPAWSAGLAASLHRNAFGDGPGETATSALGHYDQVTQVFTPTASGDVPDAVQVVAHRRVDFQFASGSRDASRTGVASRTPAAGFCVGSFAARLDSSRSTLLQALLGETLDVTTVGYAGLAGGQVGLGPLATELGLSFGSPSELLATEVRLADLLRAEAAVLTRSGDLARATILRQLVAALPRPDVPITLGSLVSIASGGEAAAAAAQVDALDLLWATAMVANGSSFLAVPDVGLALPGDLVTARGRLQVVEQPMCAFGPIGTVAHTSQVRLELTLAATVPATSATTITVDLQAGQATATSEAVTCGSPSSLGVGVTTALASSTVGVASELSVLGVPVADVALNGTTGASPVARHIAFAVPPDVLGTPRQVSTPGLNLGGLALRTDSVTVLGLPAGVTVGPLVDALGSGVVDPLLTQVDSLLLPDLAALTGLTVAGADVTPVSISCTNPRLVA